MYCHFFSGKILQLMLFQCKFSFFYSLIYLQKYDFVLYKVFKTQYFNKSAKPNRGMIIFLFFLFTDFCWSTTEIFDTYHIYLGQEFYGGNCHNSLNIFFKKTNEWIKEYFAKWTQIRYILSWISMSDDITPKLVAMSAFVMLYISQSCVSLF